MAMFASEMTDTSPKRALTLLILHQNQSHSKHIK